MLPASALATVCLFFFLFHCLFLSLCFYFFLSCITSLLKFVHPFHPSTTGGPDSPPHRVPFGENWYCPVAAAAHGSSRRCHHQWLHSPPHFSQGGPSRDCCRAARSRSLTLTGHKGEKRIKQFCTKTENYLMKQRDIRLLYRLTNIQWNMNSLNMPVWNKHFPFPLHRKDSLHYM